MLLQILDQLAVSPDSALMVGDTEYDLQMAKNARIKGVAVSWRGYIPGQTDGV